MRLALRFVLPLVILLSLIAYGVVPLVDSLTFKWVVRDMDMRTKLIASTMQESLIVALANPINNRIQNIFNRAIQDERLYAVGFCDEQNSMSYKTQTFPEEISCMRSLAHSDTTTRIIKLPQGPIHLAFSPIESDGKKIGQLILVHDLSFAQRRSSDTKKYILYFFSALFFLVSLLTVLIAQLSLRGWMKGIRSLLRDKQLNSRQNKKVSPEIRPLENDLHRFILDLETDRRYRDEGQMSWTQWTLKDILHSELKGGEVLTVSNREPYIHVKQGKGIDIQYPASGLVTALEPVMRVCSGTWIAHGSGSADKESVDENDHIQVPPDDPTYQVRRVWLSKEEEDGYYYGFANEGIWALCHIAHVRPIFRSQDWAQYVRVNEKFANAVVEEAKTSDPIVLVQDYHFALLPKMIRQRLPRATIITFWHIPFPNPEIFGVCPWREEIIDGLLGSDILGFHTNFHCHNFLDSVTRFMEARIDKETSTISYQGNLTIVNNYPISLEYPVKWLNGQKPIQQCREHIRQAHGLPVDLLVGVGIDRLDYTKGILERFRAIERLLELEPQWVGKFTFIQVAAISRVFIDQYQHFGAEVRALKDQINHRFGHAGYEPIRLITEHQSPMHVYEYYRGADLCFVSSLHDGMNLVAKEFVAARDDEKGVLILSQFTGASRELLEALIINPYNIDQCAAALKLALEMPLEQQRKRMRSMRSFLQEFNVYRWAGRMLLDASKIRYRTRLYGDAKCKGAVIEPRLPL
ncbi:MAG: trehalose-6-phosphate synthase [Bdellovibrionaceae bacterium]|nr:trehalose-6-phosphate synthase [Pseudobdellovibrionaceae bacterium]